MFAAAAAFSVAQTPPASDVRDAPATAAQDAPAPPTPATSGYVQFCQNSPSLCTAVAPERPAGYAQFCANSPTLCTKPN